LPSIDAKSSKKIFAESVTHSFDEAFALPHVVHEGVSMTSVPQQELATLLKRRLEIIADQSFRERDADAHFAALREVSEEIDAKYHAVQKELPPRLRHFMEQASYSKALDFILEQGGGGA
jgi:hypothetical protein